ncbi:type I pantothenate kinase [Lacticaseibacillus nasuensis]|uniref:hypothetical protein n=1 Tax=Lacticaseibacillus nasuensis TaxID=944671 RepID=UPI002245D43E|nr:hypothetical protein [Lacticaseibacillus nasuensis]MCX2456344.1 hypothetical protein [Lacticaseibacillus nasuensis]
MAILSELIQPILTRTPAMIGITGNVAVGKSTFARRLAQLIHGLDPTLSVAIVSTDSFLYPNAELVAQNLMAVKGAPNTYDWPAIGRFLQAIQHHEAVSLPVYDHLKNDVASVTQWVPHSDVVLVEGLIALQPAFAQQQTTSFFLTASPRTNHTWYVARCSELRLHQLYGLTPKAFATLREQAWVNTNLRNYADYVLPLLRTAGHVVALGANHQVAAIDGIDISVPAIG